MTENKRYFKRMWEDEFYIFDSQTISEKEFDEKVEYEDYQAFADSLMGDEVVDRLNELAEENKQYQQWLGALREELSLADRDNTALEKENKELKGKLEVYRELYPSGVWICDLNSDELKKELSDDWG